ncbi:23S rRNA (uracil(1939)-C(5))-methyltransferase RlmD [Deferrisoma sp.]
MIAQDDASPDPSRSPDCPHPECPGCPLGRLPLEEQLEEKRRLVSAALARARGRIAPVDPVVPSPNFRGHRAGAKLVFGRRGTRVGLGLFARGSHRVVDIPRCPAHARPIASAARALRRLVGQAPSLVWPGPGGQGWLRYAAFQASRSDGGLVVTLVTRTAEGEGPLRSLAARLCEAEPAVRGVAWNVNPSPGNAVFGPEWRALRGETRIAERFLGLDLRASPGSFLQANRELADAAYTALLEWLDPGASDELLDLYAGIGATALAAASRCRRVVGIEANPQAVADARENANRLGIPNAEFREGDAAAGAWELVSEGFRPTGVALNPARKGADPGVLEAIAALEPQRIAYLSCNPETLARDLGFLTARAPYALVRAIPYDFLPGTEHVETLALLERRR